MSTIVDIAKPALGEFDRLRFREVAEMCAREGLGERLVLRRLINLSEALRQTLCRFDAPLSHRDLIGCARPSDEIPGRAATEAPRPAYPWRPGGVEPGDRGFMDDARYFKSRQFVAPIAVLHDVDRRPQRRVEQRRGFDDQRCVEVGAREQIEPPVARRIAVAGNANHQPDFHLRIQTGRCVTNIGGANARREKRTAADVGARVSDASQMISRLEHPTQMISRLGRLGAHAL
jgi:hypothetical protein